MDVIYSFKLYFDHIIKECGLGMKVLLLDNNTINIISSVYSQSDLLPKEIYLFEKLTSISSKQPIKFMKCVCFIRPNEENVNALCNELKNPKYNQYYICFTNFADENTIKRLAESDENEKVKLINEYFVDYVAINPHFFSLNIQKSIYLGNANIWNLIEYKNTLNGLISVLLALKKKPTIRYQVSSELCRELAEGVKKTMNSDFFFNFFENIKYDNFNKPFLPVLLILDRKFDSFTPMLNQWSYQAMIHELLGLKSNKVDLSNIETEKKPKELILNAEVDEFYRNNMFLNYNEVSSNIRIQLNEFQKKSQNNKKIETLEEMKEFCEEYPEHRRKTEFLSKHIFILGELTKIINDYNLFDISEIEQELTCQNDQNKNFKKIKDLISNEKTRSLDVLRLVMLYTLKYEKNSSKEISTLTNLLKKKGLDGDKIKCIKNLLSFSGIKAKVYAELNELLSADRMKSFTKKVIKGLKTVENVYLQHSCLLKEIIEDLIACKLNPLHFPYLGTIPLMDKPREIIIFIIGGATYEESLAVYNLNKQHSDNLKIVLGSTCVHNFKSYLDEIKISN